jgi:hypothetical protein
MILDYLWRYPAYVNLLNIVDLVSVSYPPPGVSYPPVYGRYSTYQSHIMERSHISFVFVYRKRKSKKND